MSIYVLTITSRIVNDLTGSPAARLALAAVLATTLTLGTLGASASADDTVARSFGGERIATAVAASRDHRTSAEHALLATALAFPDALSAGTLAASLDAPLLLTYPDELLPAVVDELRRLSVQTVWVLGGPGAVSYAVEAQLVAFGFEVNRLGGENRYDTAAAVALEAGPAETREVVVALGNHPDPRRAWPDAVAAGALAASPDRLPVLLTGPDELPEQTERALDELETRRVLLVGGTSSIAPAVESRLRELGYEVRRIAGSSRYETSVALAAEALRRMPESQQTVIFASGQDFPDSLSAGALAAGMTGPLVLIPADDLADEVDAFLREHVHRWDTGVVVGGPAAASDFVLAQLRAAIRGEPAPTRPEPPQEEERVVGAFEGQASWYGGSFHGRSTASGETFDRHAHTAAHRTLPFGTRLRVTNTANGAQVIVRINDRGPYHRGRVLDVSEAAARDLGMISSGTAYVRAEILDG